MVSDVGNLSHGILNNFTGDGEVPLPALGWSEVLVNSGKARAGTDAGDITFQTGIDCIKPTESWIVRKIYVPASPIRASRLGPRRIAGHTQNIFDHVRTAHEAAEPRAPRSLAIPFDVPSHTYSWLEALVIWVPQ